MSFLTSSKKFIENKNVLYSTFYAIFLFKVTSDGTPAFILVKDRKIYDLHYSFSRRFIYVFILDSSVTHAERNLLVWKL